MRHDSHHNRNGRRDDGSVLPLVLVCMVLITTVVMAVANYTTTGLRYGQVVERRADRLAAADGGLRYAIQKLKKVGHHECPRIDPPDVDGATVTLTCQPVGAAFDDTSGYALILTGQEVPSGGPLLSTQGAAGGDTKRIGGLVYMNRLAFNLSSPIYFDDGQLQYTAANDAACAVPPVLPGTGYVHFTDNHLGMVCTTQPWSRAASPSDNPATTDRNEQGKYSAPSIGALPAFSATNPPLVSDPGGGACTVFQPGYYKTAPALGSNNYFRSGNYVFDGFMLEVKNQKVTAGKVLDSNGSTQSIPNTSCDLARQNDNVANVTEAGVTFYLKNGARFELNAGGSLEILRRKQGKTYVSIHVLDGSLTYNIDVIDQGPGSNKDMAIHGMVWAPEARVSFSEVANLAKGQLVGGAVLSNIDIRAAANTAGFTIAVEPTDVTGLLQLDSTATIDGTSTTIRSIVDYRPTTRYAAATSWRVID